MIFINIKYNLSISIGSTLSSPCTHITIQSTGESAYVHDGQYELFIFGKYRFLSVDARGNNMYHANIEGIDRFITKNMDNNWGVSTTILFIIKCMV